MLVKCQDTGEKIDKSLAYCDSSSGKNKYYSSKKAFDLIKDNKENRKLCIDMMYSFLDYESFMKIPTLFYRRLNEWEGYSFKVVAEAMIISEDAIRFTIRNKQFVSETAKIMYCCAIIENKLNDALKKIKREEKLKNSVVENVIEDIDLSSVGKQMKKGNGVGSLLGDGEWI